MALSQHIQQIEFCKDLIKKEVQSIEIASILVNKWQTLSERTAHRRIKDAKAQIKEEQAQIRAKVIEGVAGEIEARKWQIMNAMERKHILTQIARGELEVTKSVPNGKTIDHIITTPDYNDRKAAIAELNKMDGDYAPIKQDFSGQLLTTGNLIVNVVDSVPPMIEK